MKKISIIGCLLFVVVSAFAQPGWVKNASRSVFTLKTFAADGSLIASSNGFFTGTNGEAVSNFAPLRVQSVQWLSMLREKNFRSQVLWEPTICMMW